MKETALLSTRYSVFMSELMSHLGGDGRPGGLGAFQKGVECKTL